MTQIAISLPKSKQSLFLNPNFMILWLGQLVSQFGEAFFSFAMAIWIIRTAGAPALGGIFMVASIPGLLLGPVAGTFVDRLNRKNIIVFSDLLRGILVLAAAWLLWQQTFTLIHAYILLIIFGVFQQFFGTSISASMPNVVAKEQLPQANSLRQATASGTNLIGPALAGIILTSMGGAERAIPLFFLIKGVSYIVSGISETFLVLPHNPRPQEESFTQSSKQFMSQLKEGFRYVWQSSMLVRMMVAVAAINFFVAPLGSVILPAVIIDTLLLEEVWLGFMQSGLAAGFLLSSLTMSVIKKSFTMSTLLIRALLCFGISITLLGVAIGAPIYFEVSPIITASLMIGVMALIGVTLALASIAMPTIMQKIVPDEKRGRVFGLLSTLSVGLNPLAFGAVGMLALVAPLFTFLLVGGFGIMGATAMLARIKELRQY